jgi:choline dehydrogenase-like flavoprotein
MISADFDVIIVGAGAGGCAAAFQLCRAGWRVALIDRGAELPKDGSTLDLRCVIKGAQFMSHEPWLNHQSKKFTPEEHYNVGGKTKWYGAALLEYSREEFLAEDSHQCLGWPIEYDELKPYYDLASRLLAIRKFPLEPDLERIVMSIQKTDRRWRTEAIPLGLLSTILEDPVESTHFDGFASVRDLKSDGETSFLNHVRNLPNLTLFVGAEVCDLLPETDHFDRRCRAYGQRSLSMVASFRDPVGLTPH